MILEEFSHIESIENLLSLKKYDDAIDFFNKKFPEKYNCGTISQLDELYWILSDRFFLYGDTYKSVVYQKKAIEIELSKR